MPAWLLLLCAGIAIIEDEATTDSETPEKRPSQVLKVLVDDPVGAEIFIDGMQLVQESGAPYLTPIEIPDFPEGLYTITVASQGFRDRTVRYLLDEESEPIAGKLVPGASMTLRSPYYKTSLLQLEPPAEPGYGEEQYGPLFLKIRRSIETMQAVQTMLVGGKGGEPVAFMPREGAVLIGFRIAQGDYSGHPIIKAVQPVFLTPRGRALGRLYGQAEVATEVLAKPGYAVGGVVFKAGDRVDGLQLVFVRMRDNRLDARDSYASEWYGGTGGAARTLGGIGSPIIGVVGRAGLDLDALGLILAK